MNISDAFAAFETASTSYGSAEAAKTAAAAKLAAATQTMTDAATADNAALTVLYSSANAIVAAAQAFIATLPPAPPAA